MGMKQFEYKELAEALAYAAQGGQALHLMPGSVAHTQKRTPRCFKGHAQVAHLFDQDTARLVTTVRKLGVRKIMVEHLGTPKQHIDLCGSPLQYALEAIKREDHAIDPAKVTVGDYVRTRYLTGRRHHEWNVANGQVTADHGEILRVQLRLRASPVAIKREDIQEAWNFRDREKLVLEPGQS